MRLCADLMTIVTVNEPLREEWFNKEELIRMTKVCHLKCAKLWNV